MPNNKYSRQGSIDMFSVFVALSAACGFAVILVVVSGRLHVWTIGVTLTVLAGLLSAWVIGSVILWVIEHNQYTRSNK